MASPPQPVVLTYASTPVQGATGSTRKWSGRGALGGWEGSLVLRAGGWVRVRTGDV